MPEPPPASVEDLKELLALWPVRIRLLKIAHNRAGSVEAAEDLVAEATVILLSGKSPWRPDPGHPAREQTGALIVHVALLMRRCHSNRVNSAAARREKQVTSETARETLADRVGDGRSTLEEAAVDLEWEQEHQRRATAWIDALCARMAKDSEALALIAQHRLGVHEAEAQAAALGWSLARVVLARRRIAYHAPIVQKEQLAAEKEAEERRFADARAADEKRREEKPKDEKAKKGGVQP
jgi:hypothetical protein